MVLLNCRNNEAIMNICIFMEWTMFDLDWIHIYLPTYHPVVQTQKRQICRIRPRWCPWSCKWHLAVGCTTWWWSNLCLGISGLLHWNPSCTATNREHYTDVIMGAIASQITSLTIVYSTVYSDADQRKHQSSASLAFVWGIHRGPVNSPHKWPVTRKMFPFDDAIMETVG